MTRPTTHERILSIVQSIPAGRVTTYGAIADQVEGASARSVGRALKVDGHDAPWWRVVTAAGRPAPGVEHVARERYAQEHTPLTTHENGTYSIDLAKAFWSDTSTHPMGVEDLETLLTSESGAPALAASERARAQRPAGRRAVRPGRAATEPGPVPPAAAA